MLPPCVATGVMDPWITEWSMSTIESKVFLNTEYSYLAFSFLFVSDGTWEWCSPSVLTCGLNLEQESEACGDETWVFFFGWPTPTGTAALWPGRKPHEVHLIRIDTHPMLVEVFQLQRACPTGRRPKNMLDGLHLPLSVGTPLNPAGAPRRSSSSGRHIQLFPSLLLFWPLKRIRGWMYGWMGALNNSQYSTGGLPQLIGLFNG